jgi:hypothetical protein
VSLPSQPDPASRASARGGGFNNVESRQVQSLFREVNEQILLISDGVAGEDRLELVCECANPSCLGTLRIALNDYDDVRRFPTRFIVKPHHASADSERIVAEGSSFVVVEKLGPGAQAAIRLDPRRRRLTAVPPTEESDPTSSGGDPPP